MLFFRFRCLTWSGWKFLSDRHQTLKMAQKATANFCCACTTLGVDAPALTDIGSVLEGFTELRDSASARYAFVSYLTQGYIFIQLVWKAVFGGSGVEMELFGRDKVEQMLRHRHVFVRHCKSHLLVTRFLIKHGKLEFIYI